MALSAKHRSTARVPGLRRAGHAALAGAASLASVGLASTPAAAAETDNVWDRVADCESGGNWSINTGNGFYGGLQFWHPTWTSFGGAEFAPYAHQASKIQQITVAQRVLKVQGPGAWPVCSVRAGLTMQNGSAPYPGSGTTPAPAPAPSGTWWVAAQPGANIRSGPSTSYAVVGSASAGTKITGTMSNGWVRLADGRGWISGATLTTTQPSTPAPAPAPAPSPPSTATTWVVTATAGANIRSGPGTSYSVVGGAAHRTKVSGTLSNGWVKLADGRGFVSGSILAPEGSSTPAPSPAPAPAPPSTATSWTVTATAGANIRSGPGTSYAVVGGAAHGTRVNGTLSNGWVKLADGRGFVSGSILAPAGSGGSSTTALLVVDGSRGPLTVKAIQQWVGIAQTGSWDGATVRALQSKVGTTPDGQWGRASQAALQTHIGMPRDGSTYMSSRTVAELQRWLNANVLA